MSQNNPTIETYNALMGLINADKERKEHECREYLQYVPHLLIKHTIVQLGSEGCETRGHTGDSDYIISARVQRESGTERTCMYIWELKAPQCFIFEKDIQNRVKPTPEFIDAENKLLHHYQDFKGSVSIRAKYGVTRPDDVFIGGIVIGQTNRQVKGDYTPNEKIDLYRTACYAREVLYRPAELVLMTWSYILENMLSPSTPEPKPDATTTIDKNDASLQMYDFSYSSGQLIT